MKKVIFLFVILLFVSCSKDDSPSLTINIVSVTPPNATISWTFNGADGQTRYRIFLDGELIEDAYSGNQYTFENIFNEIVYNGTVFAISENGDETFEDFSFSTQGSDIWYGDYRVGSQADINGFDYAEITGTLVVWADDITDLTGMSSLARIGGLDIIGANALTSLDGISNVTFGPGYGGIVLRDCPNLSDVSGIANLASITVSLRLQDLPLLNNLNGVGITNDGSLYILDISLSSLDHFQEITRLKRLQLEGLPNLTTLSPLNLSGDMIYVNLRDLPNLTNLNGLNSVAVIDVLDLYDLGIPDLEGLDSLTSVHDVDIDDCNQLTNLDGTILSNAFEIDNRRPRLRIRHNDVLTDFCGFTALANSVDYGNFYQMGGNAYNPTEAQMESSTECSQ